MRVVVLDTNVIVSAAIQPQSPPGLLILDWVLEDRIQWVTSPLIVTEYQEVVRRPKFHRYAFPPRWLDYIVSYGFHLPDPPSWPISLSDPKDAAFLALAHATSACLVTGNQKHFPPTVRNGVTVLSPAAYLEFLTTSR